MARHEWLADACRDAGLRVVEVQGWRTRGSETFTPRGLVLHHTAGPAKGDMPSLSLIVSGRADLPGPLANFGLGRSGTVYVVAAGRANHAGAGGWRGLSGNASVWGIEAENTGVGEPWPAAQLDAYHLLAAVLAERTPFDPALICAHREWAPTRKIDPTGIDPAAFRARVAELLEDDMALTAEERKLLQDTHDKARDAVNYGVAILAALNQFEETDTVAVDAETVARRVDELLARRLAT